MSAYQLFNAVASSTAQLFSGSWPLLELILGWLIALIAFSLLIRGGLYFARLALLKK